MLWQQLTRSLGALAPSQGTRCVIWCQAKGCRNGRSVLNLLDSVNIWIVVSNAFLLGDPAMIKHMFFGLDMNIIILC